MPAKNPRVATVVDASVLAWLRARARHEGVSLSLVVRDILRQFREDDEERYWANAAGERLATFAREQAAVHEDAWK